MLLGRCSSTIWSRTAYTLCLIRVSTLSLNQEAEADNGAYGRYLLPPHPPHQSVLEDPRIHHRYRRVFLRPYSQFKTLQEAYDTTEIIHADDVKLTKEEIVEGVKHGGRWVTYSVWEMDEPEGGWEAGGRGKGVDLVMVHGWSAPLFDRAWAWADCQD